MDKARNEMLTRVGRGTPMGELLRRYWHPIAGASELADNPIKPIRLMGEDLVLYQDLSGRYGLLDRHCPHRRADLSYGFVEKAGIRCNYHGWLMDEHGGCVEQPFEDTFNPASPLRKKCTSPAYPVRELAGLLWTYMGPEPAPELPVWDPFTWSNGFKEIVACEVPCNWFQCQENSIDPVHFEWMHDNWGMRQRGETGPYAARHLKLGFDEFEYGFQYRRIREGATEQDPLWTVGRVTLWPNGFYLGSHFEWRIPVDDENTLNICWFFTRVPTESEPYVQNRIPTWYGPIKNEKGRWISSHIINQDVVAWVGQGTIADRSKELLGSSDRGVAMIRNRFFQDMDAVAAGRDPKGIIRDPEIAKSVKLPVATPRTFTASLPREQWQTDPYYSRRAKRFPWQAGQPNEVWSEFASAMGIDPAQRDPSELRAG
jgi:5,5'-dehydrodivanillate O-demethylase oxygenase subunit